MRAGFARVSITPPLGTKMMGVGQRDLDHGCDSIHDDIYVRALYVEHDGEIALIMSLDLCFVGRGDTARWKGAIGRHFDILPRQIMVTATHSHVSPAVGTWYAAGYAMPDRDYLIELETAVVAAACRARESAQEATLWTGSTQSTLPMNRRRLVNGKMENAPNPDGPVCDVLPICLIKNANEQPIALLFSVAAHPSILRDFAISAEFPGVACDQLDEYLGATASLFSQGIGGDSKPSTIAVGNEWKWQADWQDVEATGTLLARETIGVIEAGLTQVNPQVSTAITDTAWPLQPPPSHAEFEAIAATGEGLQPAWAKRQIERLERGTLPTAVPFLVQGVQLGEGLRLIAIEGEPLAHYGHMILNEYSSGVTFPLGYANGEAMYLVTSPMLDEGGMEPESYWEYGYPAPLAKGMEAFAEQAISKLREAEIG